MKKIIVLLLALMMTANTVFAADIVKETYKEKTDVFSLIQELGIISEDDVVENEETVLTRGQFTKIVYNVVNYSSMESVPSASKSYFTDIDIYHYAAGYIQCLVENGIVKGYGDGTYRPENEITVDEAARILVRAAGYGICEEYGTSITAQVEEVKRGVSGTLTYENAAEMVYNLLFINSITNKLSESGKTFEESDIVLRKIMKLDYVDGVVETVGGKSLYSTGVNSRKVVVSGKELWSTGETGTDLLGMYARVFYDDEENVCAMSALKNTVVKIEAEDVESFADNKLCYYSGNGKKYLKLSSEKDVLYNGYVTDSVSDNLPKYGSVTLIDRNSDNSYDVVMIEEYRSYIVKNAGDKSRTIDVKNVSDDGSAISVNLDDYENVVIEDENGGELTLKTISENSAIMVYSFEQEYIKIVVSTEKATGALTKIYTDGDKQFIVVDDNEYELYSGYYSTGDLSIGETVTVLNDIYGRTAGIISVVTEGWKVGYLISAEMIEDDFADKIIRLKLVNENGTVEKVKCVEKPRVDGVKKTTAEAYAMIESAYSNFADTITINGKSVENFSTRLIRYYQTEDGVQKLDLPVTHGLYEESRPTNFNADNELLLQVKGNLYVENNNIFRTIYGCSIPGEIYFNDNSLMFMIPEESNTDPDDDDYGVIKGKNFKQVSGKFYDMSGYTLSSDQLTTDYAVIRKNAGESTELTALVIDSVNLTVNSDNEVVYQVKSLDGDSYPVNEKSSSVPAQSLKKGDVVAYEMSNGELIVSKLLYRENGGILSQQGYYAPNNDGKHSNISYRFAIGKVGKIDGNYVSMIFNDTTMTGEIVKMPATISFCEYGGTPYLYLGDKSDVRKGDTIITAIKGGSLRKVIIIKNQ